MASLSLTNSEIVRAILQTLGAGRDPANMDEATEADVRAIIRDGLRRFYFPTVGEYVYQWRWLEKWHAIPTLTSYSTGTIAVAGGTVTISGGSWPSSMSDYLIVVNGHVLFPTANAVTTTVAVSHTQLTISAGASFVAYKYRYALPSGFGEWLGGVVYQNGSDVTRLVKSSEPEIRLRYAVGQGLDQTPSHYDITSTPTAAALSMVLWPIPPAEGFIQGVYLSIPDDNLPADLVTPGVIAQVTPIYAKAVTEAILAEAENYLGKTGGEHEARFKQALAIAIAHDKAAGGEYDFSRQIPPDYRGIGPPPTSIDFSTQL